MIHLPNCSLVQARQLAEPKVTGDNIIGVMIESHLVEGKQCATSDLTQWIKMVMMCIGRQDIPSEGAHRLTYGQSITDACINWEDTVKTLDTLREGVRARRAARRA